MNILLTHYSSGCHNLSQKLTQEAIVYTQTRTKGFAPKSYRSFGQVIFLILQFSLDQQQQSHDKGIAYSSNR